MKISMTIPDGADNLIGKDFEKVSTGIISGWLLLPTEIQKFVSWSGIKYDEVQGKYSERSFIIEIKLELILYGNRIERSFTIEITDFSVDIARHVASSFRSGVIKTLDTLRMELDASRAFISKILS